MVKYFSIETKNIVGKSRDIASEMGYDHISTMHFFFADCESGSNYSLLNFAFKSLTEYSNFKNSYLKEIKDLLNFVADDITLTTEAETAIRSSLFQKKKYKQQLIYPWHLFLAILDNKESFLSECFKDDPDIKNKLVNYYTDLGVFDLYTNVSFSTKFITQYSSVKAGILKYLKQKN